jgi:predicted amidophosphoribosyltransferase
MRDRLRARAVRLMRQLDDAATFREQIERDLAAVLAAGEFDAGSPAAPSCRSCGAIADPDARFCKMCGEPIPPTVA